MKKAVLVVLVALTLPSITFAQSGSRQKVTQAIEWFSWANNVKVHKNLNLIVEGQFRFAGNFEPMQFQFRTAPEILVNKNLSIVPIGYVYTWNPIYGKQPAKFVNNEHRFWQQVIYKHHIGRVHFAHRGRLEQRHIQIHVNNNGEIINQGYNFYTNRFRYRLAANVPLNHKEMGPNTWFASFYNETFIEWGKNIVYHKPDQNRLFVGAGYQVNKKLTVNAGFLYHMLIKINGVMQENNLGMQANVTYNFDLTKDTKD